MRAKQFIKSTYTYVEINLYLRNTTGYLIKHANLNSESSLFEQFRIPYQLWPH